MVWDWQAVGDSMLRVASRRASRANSSKPDELEVEAWVWPSIRCSGWRRRGVGAGKGSRGLVAQDYPAGAWVWLG
jgi:hypothetical protein